MEPVSEPWSDLRRFTAARIALGRAGGSLPTRALLDFRLSHARARDAVLADFDPEKLAEQLRSVSEQVVVVDSRAANRAEFLQRPDFGRRLAPTSRPIIEAVASDAAPVDLVIIVSDGLSTRAVMEQARPLLASLIPLLAEASWALAPIVVVRHGRVAIQDEIGGILNAGLSLMLLGERPGLGSPDSLGAYFTFAPVVGRSDAERNCVSNIRPEGLPPRAAAEKLFALLTMARQRKLTGVGLKDETPHLGQPEVREALHAG